MGFEPTTFRSTGGCANHCATSAWLISESRPSDWLRKGLVDPAVENRGFEPRTFALQKRCTAVVLVPLADIFYTAVPWPSIYAGLAVPPVVIPVVGELQAEGRRIELLRVLPQTGFEAVAVANHRLALPCSYAGSEGIEPPRAFTQPVF